MLNTADCLACSYTFIIIVERIANAAFCGSGKSSSVFPGEGVGRAVIVGEGIADLGLLTPTSWGSGGLFFTIMFFKMNYCFFLKITIISEASAENATLNNNPKSSTVYMFFKTILPINNADTHTNNIWIIPIMKLFFQKIWEYHLCYIRIRTV